jgi:hypothetical protein
LRLVFGLAFGAAVFCLSPLNAARACDLDHASSTRWSIARHGAISSLVSPCGEEFYSTGVNVLDGGITAGYLDRPHYDWRNSYASLGDWIGDTKQRLANWGFNSAGAWSLPPKQLKLPSIINLELGRLARFHWFDPFEPAAEQRMFEQAKLLTEKYRDSSYRIGYFSDNEVGWWDGALFLFYGQKPSTSFTKQRWTEMLREYYRGDWQRFNMDFVPPAGVDSWEALLAAEKPTKLRIGGNGMPVVERWTGIVAEQYYKIARAALKAADPDALFFGDRLPIYYDQAAIRAETPYVDGIALNYNVDSPEGWLAPYFFDGLRKLTNGKAELISEWFYAAHENRTGNRNNGHLMTVETQAQRAAGAATSAKLFAGVPEILGTHWFQYYDYPVGGRADSEDYNFGLVDIRNRPYEQLVEALSAANRQLPAIHHEAGAIARPGTKDFAVPYAKIDPQHLSLIDWPKPASLLPRLKPSPGAVAFGEAYLSWSKQGLALATIGQDYDDLGLLDYGATYPLSEAYRIELDVDAGAGPKRFTLYFIPPKGSTKDYPPMAPKLCAGTVAELQDNDCPAVPGAQTLYFGADQPRIVAEAMLPWSALGLGGPPKANKLAIEVSAVSWDNGRWMSLSGLPPEKGSAATKRWLTVPLAGE